MQPDYVLVWLLVDLHLRYKTLVHVTHGATKRSNDVQGIKF